MMTVEMSRPNRRGQIKIGSRKSGGEDVQMPAEDENRLSDDVCSLNSWSEKISLSTSSSSESGSRHGSASRWGGRNRDVKTKQSCESKKSAHNYEQKASARGVTRSKVKQVEKSKQSASENQSRPKAGASEAAKNFEFEDSSLSSLSLGNYDYQYEAPVSDSDFNYFTRYTFESGNYEQPQSQLVDSVDGHRELVQNRSKRDGTAKCQEINPLKLQAQNLYPDFDTILSQGEVLDQPSSTPQTAATAAVGNNPPQGQTQRPKFFDYHKQPSSSSQQLKKRLPKHSQSHSTDLYSRPFSSLPVPASHSTEQEHSEISPASLSHYQPNRIETVSHQGKASLSGRLHKSQPSISSTPHLKRQPKSSSDLESLRQSYEHRLEPENVKSAVKSMWNNFKYGWSFQSKVNMKSDSPLFMLGKCYHSKGVKDTNTESESDFLKDFASRIWLTYRSKFYPIPGTKLSTDCGWGCMLRSGQMLIAQSLLTHYLGRDWRLYDKQTETQLTFYRSIIRWFSDPLDTPSDQTPFCLHHLASIGRTYNKNPGEWYGPASVAYIFRDAFTKASQTLPILSQICIYVAQDCTVYIDDVIKLCTERQKSDSMSNSSEAESLTNVEGATASHSTSPNDTWLRSLIILIPMRLGGEVMNEIYIPCVKSLLSQDNCMGIIGGKPKHSLYFLGWQDDKLIYLDPHLCRDAVDTSTSNFRIESFHCMTPRKLNASKMDPSCTVGFYIKNATDFRKFVSEVKEFVSPPKQRGTYPLFIFSEKNQYESSANHINAAAASDRRVRVTHYHYDENGQKQRTFSRDSEDFVML